MNLKKVKIISAIAVFILTVIFHFLYNLYPNFIFSVLFPVNESIWEHMKLLVSGLVIWSIIEYIILKKYKIKFNNFAYQLFITTYSSVIIYLLIYLPIYHIIGENIFISIGLLILVIILEEIISYKILKSKKENRITSKISIILIIIIYILFIVLTYYPPENYIFYDTKDNIYGIKNKTP